MAGRIAGLLAGCALLMAGCSASTGHRSGSLLALLAGNLPSNVYKVPSVGSMEPTLSVGSRVSVGKSAPFVGAIVVDHVPKNAEQQMCGPRPHEVRPGGAACDVAEPGES